MNRQKKPSTKERLFIVAAGNCYLQFVQVHSEPQLQFTHVQLGLLHFTF